MPTHLARRAGAILLAAAAVLPAGARADTHWRCELSRDLVRLVCRAELPPAAAVPAVASVPTAQVHGTRFPLDPARPWTVDLWTPPTERDRVELLARATICYRSPGCTVSLTWPDDLAAR